MRASSWAFWTIQDNFIQEKVTLFSLLFTSRDQKFDPEKAAIPPEDIENPEEYKKILLRLEQLADFGPSFQPMANFSLFEFYNRTGIQLNELLLGEIINFFL